MFDWKKLYQTLATKKPGSWRALGRELAIPPATFTRLKEGRSVSSWHMIQLLEFLGASYSQFKRPPSRASRSSR